MTDRSTSDQASARVRCVRPPLPESSPAMSGVAGLGQIGVRPSFF